jgi:hypothetical protein
MDSDGLRAGHLLALAGAGLLLLTLWLPWFEVRLGPLARSEVGAAAAQLGEPFAALADGVLSHLDGLRLTAWDAFDGEDVALAAGAGGVVALLLAAAGGAGPGVRVAPDVAGRVAALAGLALGGLVLVRLVSRPGSSEVLQLAQGGRLALAGCALVVVGGALGARAPRRAPALAAAFPPVVGPGAPPPLPIHPDRTVAATSVAPPARRGTPTV